MGRDISRRGPSDQQGKIEPEPIAGFMVVHGGIAPARPDLGFA
jgi:hypothetical protein